MSRSDTEVVVRLLEALDGDLVEILSDPERVRAIGELAAPLGEPDARITFHGADAVVLPGELRGFEGLIAGWREWLSTFASYSFDLERVFQDGDRVIVLVRQRGRTIHGGVEVPSSPSAGVFTIRDGRVARVAFYLDRTQAAKAEGFELP